MAVFEIKRGDLKVMDRTLWNPDKTRHDLTGVSKVYLHIRLAGSTTVLSREMTVVGDPTQGDVRYIFESADWEDGALVAGEHDMEYEAVGSPYRNTIPSDRYDRLVVTADLADGT